MRSTGDAQVDANLPTVDGTTYNGPDCTQQSQQTDTSHLWCAACPAERCSLLPGACWTAAATHTGCSPAADVLEELQQLTVQLICP